MSDKTYTFISPSEAAITPYELPPIKYYQICGFANPRKQKYEVRVVNIDGSNNIVNYKLYAITKFEHDKLLKSLRDNLYRLYATFTLDTIELPSCNDIAVARSDMINIDNDYIGFARLK